MVGEIDKTKTHILDRPHKDVFNAQKTKMPLEIMCKKICNIITRMFNGHETTNGGKEK